MKIKLTFGELVCNITDAQGVGKVRCIRDFSTLDVTVRAQKSKYHQLPLVAF
jgi:hypothetical protein